MQRQSQRLIKWLNFGRRNPGLLAGVLMLLPFLLFALLPAVFASHDPIKTSIRELYTRRMPSIFLAPTNWGAMSIAGWSMARAYL